MPRSSKWASPSPPKRHMERMSLCSHRASRALTTNHPAVTGTPSSIRASLTPRRPCPEFGAGRTRRRKRSVRQSCRHAGEALGRDRLERIAERRDALLAEPVGPLLLDLVDQPDPERLRGASALGQPDDLRAAVARVRNALDVAALLE